MAPEEQVSVDFDALNASYLEALLDLIAILIEDSDSSDNEPTLRAEEIREQASAQGWVLPFDWLVRRYELDDVEIAILSLAMAPYLDDGFRDRIARFRDNVLLGFVDGHFAFHLIFENRARALLGRRYLSRDATLRQARLIELVPHRDAQSDHTLSQELRVPSRILSFVTGLVELDESIAEVADLRVPDIDFDDLVLPEEERAELVSIVERGENAVSDRPFLVRVSGPPGSGRSTCARAIASSLNKRLLTVDCARLADSDRRGSASILAEAFRAADLYEAVLCFDHAHAALGEQSERLGALREELAEFRGFVLFATEKASGLSPDLEALTALALDLTLPLPELRERLWDRALETQLAASADDVDVPDLALLFELNGGQIDNAVRLAIERTPPNEHGGVMLDRDTLERAAHAQLRADIADYTKRSHVDLNLEDLVLPEQDKAQVHQLLQAARHRAFVMNRWGFGKRLVTGKGIVAMFTGEPGTGKTLCAEILASEMGLRLYQVSIPRIMSKYIGDTEKNIEKVFSAARASHSMLLFDEADALFTKRVKVERSVDRFSNMGVNLLLQEIERFEGVVLLTTNLERDLDPAFQRRITFKIRFPFPDAEHREIIWKKLIPPECPLDDGVDYEILAKSFELAGGHIKNVILRAAYRAASLNESIAMAHFRTAAEAECRSAGKLYRHYDD